MTADDWGDIAKVVWTFVLALAAFAIGITAGRAQ